MDSGRGVKLIKIKGPGELEVTTTGIQLLQSFSNPLGIVTVTGVPKSGKSYLANRILGTQGGYETDHTTKGIWIWSEPIKVTLKDDSGSEKEGEVLVVDCESIFKRNDDNKGLSQDILALVSLLSSHIVLISTNPITSQSLADFEVLNDISNFIQIKKGQDSKNNLSNYLPKLTWIVTGTEVQDPEK
jgi:Guanylate-binding protein, N-terminal domain